MNLSKAIFYNLNGGQQVVYQGESDTWQGKVILNYYNNFWTDEKGVLHSDSWNHEQHVLKFKGDSGKIKGNFSCDFKSAAGETKLTNDSGFDPPTGPFAGSDSPGNYGAVTPGFGGIGGSGAMPLKDEVITVTVKWNNQQENLDLKAAE